MKHPAGRVLAVRANVRRSVLSLGVAAMICLLLQGLLVRQVFSAERPNIVYILADDLGVGELGCYGQRKIQTPNIDQLAKEGMRFTEHYSGNPVCAPTRCVLLTGLHTGHADIRSNKEIGGWGKDEKEGQWPIPENTQTIARLLQQRGYSTAAIGKWGLGGPDSSGQPNLQGFDHFFGYLCQRVAHNYYPTHLWRNTEKVMLRNEYFDAHQKLAQEPRNPEIYKQFQGKDYAPDLMIEEALGWVKDHQDEPFFLYYATPVPHVSLQVPDDSLQQYSGKFDTEPYLGQKGYLPHPEPRAAYAAMVTRMDGDIGRIVRLIDELGLKEQTLILFSSDNGPTFNGGTDSPFFASAMGRRGLKASVYEGGIRVPLIARWPGKIEAGTTSDLVSAHWDVFPTLCEVAGIQSPGGIDGISLTPTLLNQGQQPQHEVLYWELGKQQALRSGDWKLVRIGNAKNEITQVQLFNLKEDPNETTSLAEQEPEVLQQMIQKAQAARTKSEVFPSPFDQE